MKARYFRYCGETKKVVEVDRQFSRNRPQYPLPCAALAVHPAQISEAREHARASGVSTDFRSDGTPIMRDASHYKRYRKLQGVHFKNGFES